MILKNLLFVAIQLFLIHNFSLADDDKGKIIGLGNTKYMKRGQLIKPVLLPDRTVDNSILQDTKSIKITTLLTCEWRNNVKPNLITGNNCNNTNKKICTGFVTCQQIRNNTKIILNRLATCSEKACLIGPDECSLEKTGYYSKRFVDDSNNPRTFNEKKATEIKSIQ